MRQSCALISNQLRRFHKVSSQVWQAWARKERQFARVARSEEREGSAGKADASTVSRDTVSLAQLVPRARLLRSALVSSRVPDSRPPPAAAPASVGRPIRTTVVLMCQGLPGTRKRGALNAHTHEAGRFAQGSEIGLGSTAASMCPQASCCCHPPSTVQKMTVGQRADQGHLRRSSWPSCGRLPAERRHQVEQQGGVRVRRPFGAV